MKSRKAKPKSAPRNAHGGGRRAGSHTPATIAQQRTFLAAFAELGVVTQSAERAGIDRRRHTEWLETDAAYRQAFADASEKATDLLEGEARRRAFEGWDEPVYQKGEMVGVIRRYSDRLLEILLRARRPAEFREKTEVQLAGAGGKPLTIRVVYESGGQAS